MQMNVRTTAKAVAVRAVKTAAYLGADNQLPEYSEAKKMLLEYSPDNGGMAYTERLWESLPKGKCQLSVIMPVYMTEQYVEQAVLSVLSQKTNVSFELILINDGSPDGSREIIARFETDPRVLVIDQENKGLSGARNAGLDQARGDYIMFVDSDDTLCENAIQNLMDCALNHDADVVAGGFYSIKNDKKTKSDCYLDEKVRTMGTLMGYSWGKVYKRWIFRNLRFPDNYWYEDSIFAQLVWPRCEKCYTISAFVYNYRNNMSGISKASMGNPKSLDSLYITERLIKEKERFGLSIQAEDYEYFLHMVLLTKRRTWPLPEKIRKCIFVVQCELWQKYYMGFTTRKNKKLEKALKEMDYKKYLLI